MCTHASTQKLQQETGEKGKGKGEGWENVRGTKEKYEIFKSRLKAKQREQQFAQIYSSPKLKVNFSNCCSTFLVFIFNVISNKYRFAVSGLLWKYWARTLVLVPATALFTFSDVTAVY